MISQSLYNTFQRYKTLQTDIITSLPIVILMPHSACNCKCVMCDIWKDNKNLKQLTHADIRGLLDGFRKFGTRQVVMSGGEALLNPNFFALCEILRKENINISLLSTGLLIERNADAILKWVNDLVVSLDGNEKIHDEIRNIPGAFNKLKEGIHHLHALNPAYRITGRSVIHRLNFRHWPDIIRAAHAIGLNQISFLAADVSSHAFNRQQAWDDSKQQEILIKEEELPDLQEIINHILSEFAVFFQSGFIAESPVKLQKIYSYYAAFYGLNPFPNKKCNAPWVSTVIEADGSVRPCFFHKSIGNIKEASLPDILNSHEAFRFRKSLDINTDSTCRKCVCYLNLPPRMNPGYGQ
jgi:Fe-coproporphyrin III synthase